jgi:hypothetical protein
VIAVAGFVYLIGCVADVPKPWEFMTSYESSSDDTIVNVAKNLTVDDVRANSKSGTTSVTNNVDASSDTNSDAKQAKVAKSDTGNVTYDRISAITDVKDDANATSGEKAADDKISKETAMPQASENKRNIKTIFLGN